jgi:hypothetical protein
MPCCSPYGFGCGSRFAGQCDQEAIGVWLERLVRVASYNLQATGNIGEHVCHAGCKCNTMLDDIKRPATYRSSVA